MHFIDSNYKKKKKKKEEEKEFSVFLGAMPLNSQCFFLQMYKVVRIVRQIHKIIMVKTKQKMYRILKAQRTVQYDTQGNIAVDIANAG